MFKRKKKTNYSARDDINKTKTVVFDSFKRVTRNGIGIALVKINKTIKKIHDKV